MAINWNTIYAPKTIDELALYPALKDELNLYYDDGDYGHLIFAGGWGTGKTTASHILGKKHPNDFVEYDCAGYNTKKELRKIITGTFAVSMLGSKRIVLLDEFHFLAKLLHFCNGARRHQLPRHKAQLTATAIIVDKLQQIAHHKADGGVDAVLVAD